MLEKLKLTTTLQQHDESVKRFLKRQEKKEKRIDVFYLLLK